MPNQWAADSEDAIVYVIKAPANGYSNVLMSFGVDNGIFVWLDGKYLGGHLRPGYSVPGEHQFTVNYLAAGTHYLQVLREDHGVVDGYDVSVTADAKPNMPLNAFSAEVTLAFGALANDDTFSAKETFTLGDGSNGIDPITEEVNLQVGAFSTIIPAGSFTLDRKGCFRFEGEINHVALKVVIHSSRGGKFTLWGSGAGADLTGTQVPMTVGLTIGDDGGNTSSLANGKAKFKTP